MHVFFYHKTQHPHDEFKRKEILISKDVDDRNRN